jgi:hypothetical protein
VQFFRGLPSFIGQVSFFPKGIFLCQGYQGQGQKGKVLNVAPEEFAKPKELVDFLQTGRDGCIKKGLEFICAGPDTFLGELVSQKFDVGGSEVASRNVDLS